MIDEKLGYSPKTQKLIDKLCKIAERKSYTLKKKEAEKTILKTYDLFDLPRPKKIVWYTHITQEFKDIASNAYSAYRASSAFSAFSASSAYNASRASRAYSAFSAYSASSAYRAFRVSNAYSAYIASNASNASNAYSAYRAYSAFSAYRASRAYSAFSASSTSRASIDIDFDFSVCNFEYIQNPGVEKPNRGDKKYFEYSKLIIKAKELGLGYFIDYEDVLYLVPVPLISCNEEGEYHNEKKPAIYWKGGEELFYLKGVKFEKEWWTKIVNDELTPEEILAIDNIEHRRIAWEYMDKKKLEGLKDFKVLDEVKDDGKGNPMRIVSFKHPDVDEPVKYYNCFCPTTGREYYLGTEEETCQKAKAKSFGLEEIEFTNEW